MRYELDIEYPPERMAANRRRWMAWKKYTYADRVRVQAGVETRNMLAARGVSWRDYMDNVEDHYYHQLLNHKWRIETVPDDFCIEPVILVLPDAQNTIAAAFGAEIHLLEDDAPRMEGWIKTPEDVDHLEVPSPTEGYWGKTLGWYQRMLELAQDTKLTFNGVPGRIRVGVKEISDPLTICIDLVGQDVLWWVYEYPGAVEKLLDKVVAGYIGWMQHARRVTGNPGRVMYSGGDGGSLLPEPLYRKFMVARYQRIWSIHPGERHFHMCGRMGHLLPIVRDEYHIDEFWGFGYQVPAEEVGRELGGYCRLLGNLDPILVHSGPVEKIRQAALACIEVLAPYGGHSLCDGYNLPPGTPMAHIQAMVEAAEAYGRPEITQGPIAQGTRQVPHDPPLEMAFH